MSIYEKFATRMFLPVPIDAVAEELLESGCCASITYFEVDTDPRELAGICRVHRERPPYALDDNLHLHVIYSSKMDLQWRRMVVCKELLHAVDSEEERAATREQVERLIDEIILPSELVGGIQSMSDRFGLLNALRVLLPRDALSELKELRENGSISEDDVSSLAQIPEPLAKFAILSPIWQQILDNY